MNLFHFWRKKGSRAAVRLRSYYIDPSRRFLDFVQHLGIEKTWAGELLQRLESRFQIRWVALLFLFCLLLSLVIFSDFEFPYAYQAGDVATTDIKSPVNLQLVDEVSTEQKRQEASAHIPPVFDFDPQVFEGALTNVYKSFRTMRKIVRAQAWPTSEARMEEAVKDFLQYKPLFEKELNQPVSDRLFEWLTEHRFSARIENMVIRSLMSWSTLKIAEGAKSQIPNPDSPLVIRTISESNQSQEARFMGQDVVFMKDRDLLKLSAIRGLETLTKRDVANLVQFAQSLLVPNLTFNNQETVDRRARARDQVLPVQISLKKNQTIVPAGSVVQPSHVLVLDEILSLKADRRSELMAVIAAFLFLMVILVFYSYTRRFTTNRVKVDLKDLSAMAVITLAVVLFVKLFLFMTDAAFLSRFGSLIPPSVLLFAAPVASGPMLVGLLITSGEIVWLYSAFLAMTLAMMVDMNFPFLLVTMISGIAAARGVYNCKKRNDIYWAGIRSGFVSAGSIATLILMQKLGDHDLLHLLVWNVPAGLFSGVLSSMVAMTLIPLLESAFNYTTDVKLLELASLNHPLMQQMIVRAPGTYHHSLVVGSMVEAAATEIGANPLLSKVMAYYHDIGKMDHAQYFIENQRPGFNPHDSVTPYMSKTILIAHVKDGAELGLQHKLGKPIIDGILQHHGTTLISYFYNKALEEQNTDIDTVEEDDFRYPGPKPQFREAALVMLADSIEAAARSLDDPTPSRLQNIVKNIIQTKFLDGQLEECNLTLRDLSVIEQAFKRVLLGIYHQRIDYPKSQAAKAPNPVGKILGSSQGRHRKGHFSA